MVARASLYFALADLCEGAGGYLASMWQRYGRADRWDVLGGLIALVGVGVIMDEPRGSGAS